MRTERFLLIDHNAESLKPAMDDVVAEAGVSMIYSSNLEDGYVVLENNAISTIIMGSRFIRNVDNWERVISDLKSKFPEAQVAILNENVTQLDVDETQHLHIEESAIFSIKSFNMPKLLSVLNKIYSGVPQEDKIESDSLQFISSKGRASIIDGSLDVSYYAYQLISIAGHENLDNLSEYIYLANDWHYKFWNMLGSTIRNEVMASILLRKRPDLNDVELFIAFRIMGSKKNKNSTDMILALIDNLVSGVNASKPGQYSFEPLADPQDLKLLLFPSTFKKSVRLFPTPQFWGSMTDYAMEAENEEVEIMADFLPSFPSFKNNIDYSYLIPALSKLLGTSLLAMHLLPINLAANEIQFLKKVTKDEVSHELDDLDDLEEISAFEKKVLISHMENPSSNYLFELRFISDTHQEIPLILQSELMAQVFYRTKPDFSIQEGLFDNLFSIDKRLKLSRLSFLRDLDELYRVFQLPFPRRQIIQGLPYHHPNRQIIPVGLPLKGFQLGEKHNGKFHTEIRIDLSSLKSHMYMLGQTGTGKTTMLKTMIMDAIHSGSGLCVIDPHGDLFEDVFRMIPANRLHEVVVFDTTDLERSSKLNFLVPDVRVDETKLIDELLCVLASEFDMKLSGGPMFEMYFKAVMKLVLHPAVRSKYPVPTLQLAYRTLQLPKLLNHLLELVNENDEKISTVNEEWSEYISSSELQELFNTARQGKSDWEWDNIRPYIYSKLKFFVDNAYIRELFDSTKPNLDFRKIMDSGNILLVRIQKGNVGDANLKKVGRLFLNSLIFSIMSRADTPQYLRKDFFVFIDEFQNFLDGDIGSALSEVRKFNVGLVLANQTLGQLNDHLIQSVLGNVGSTVFFRTGLNDIGKVRHYVEPDFTPSEMINLQNYNCVARLMIDGKPSKPFLFQTIPTKDI